MQLASNPGKYLNNGPLVLGSSSPRRTRAGRGGVRRGLQVGLVTVLLAIGCTDSDPDGSPSADASDIPSDSGSWDAPVGQFDAASGGFDASGDAIAANPCGLPAPGAVVDVSVADLYGRITAADALAVVDVREPGETASGIIEGALLYPWTSGVLSSDHADLPDDVPLFIICHSGSRSALASQFLFDNDHECVHNVLGGMSAWNAAEYPTVLP
jgi:rhodanese-related sulfurtransferase